MACSSKDFITFHINTPFATRLDGMTKVKACFHIDIRSMGISKLKEGFDIGAKSFCCQNII